MKWILVSTGEGGATPLDYPNGRPPGGEPIDDGTETSVPSSREAQSSGHGEHLQVHKALTDYVFAEVAAGQTDEQRPVVSGLTHRGSIARMAELSRR